MIRNEHFISRAIADFRARRTSAERFAFLREDSVQMKGIAILVMLGLHLFNEPWKLDLCTPLISFGNVSLVQILGRVAGICVGLYLFLSGFGQFCIWRKEEAAGTPLPKRFLTNFLRVFRLYRRLWLVGGACVALLVAFGINNFEITWASVLGNATGWRCSFNATWWFLFPWSIVCLASPMLFRFFFRGNSFLRDLLKILGAIIVNGGGGIPCLAFRSRKNFAPVRGLSTTDGVEPFICVPAWRSGI